MNSLILLQLITFQVFYLVKVVIDFPKIYIHHLFNLKILKMLVYGKMLFNCLTPKQRN